jgi:hypothetical protein
METGQRALSVKEEEEEEEGGGGGGHEDGEYDGDDEGEGDDDDDVDGEKDDGGYEDDIDAAGENDLMKSTDYVSPPHAVRQRAVFDLCSACRTRFYWNKRKLSAGWSGGKDVSIGLVSDSYKPQRVLKDLQQSYCRREGGVYLGHSGFSTLTLYRLTAN